MKDVFAARKMSRALELCVQLARMALSVADVRDVCVSPFCVSRHAGSPANIAEMPATRT